MSTTSITQLKATQNLLWTLITAPEGVSKALKTRPQKKLPIRESRRLTAEACLDIYANMYFFRIRDALKDEFPALHTHIGENAFHDLITDYLIAFPPTHYSLRYAGQNLPVFLKKHALTKKKKYLADLARFEWELGLAFDAADASALTKSQLQKFNPEEFSHLKFKFLPCVNATSFDYPIHLIHRKITGKKPLVKTDLSLQKTRIAFWRRDLKSYYRVLTTEELRVFSAAKTGKNFAALCEMMLGRRKATEKSLTTAAQKMAKYLDSWLSAPWLSSF